MVAGRMSVWSHDRLQASERSSLAYLAISAHGVRRSYADGYFEALITSSILDVLSCRRGSFSCHRSAHANT